MTSGRYGVRVIETESVTVGVILVDQLRVVVYESLGEWETEVLHVGVGEDEPVADAVDVSEIVTLDVAEPDNEFDMASVADVERLPDIEEETLLLSDAVKLMEPDEVPVNVVVAVDVGEPEREAVALVESEDVVVIEEDVVRDIDGDALDVGDRVVVGLQDSE